MQIEVLQTGIPEISPRWGVFVDHVCVGEGRGKISIYAMANELRDNPDLAKELKEMFFEGKKAEQK